MEKLLTIPYNASVDSTPMVKKIGISNYNVTQIEQLLAVAKIKPYVRVVLIPISSIVRLIDWYQVHQIELHPYLQQNDFVDFHKKHGIRLVAYAPLGNTNPEYAYRAKMTNPILQDVTLNRIAKKRGCSSAAQVALAWNLKRGITVIPKAEKLEHQKENYLTVSQCKLTDADMASIKRLDLKARYWDMCCSLGLPCYLGLDGALDEPPVSDDYCAFTPGITKATNSYFRAEKNNTGLYGFQLPVAFKSEPLPAVACNPN
jgi:alcohol dehydrogenase (NADP+)